jgi:aminoglycoside phosphotransferase family enzyme/predicted kinase
VIVGPTGERLVAAAPGHEPPEHCVVMRRLPSGRDALSLLEAGRLRAGQVERVAELLAAFHAGHRLGSPAPFAPEEWQRRLTRPVEDNFRLLEGAGGVVPRPLLARAARRAREFVVLHADRFEARRLAGRAVDGHGDLHLQHVWFETDAAPPLLIDCLEFREDLRRIDAASDLAFLAMDLRYRRRAGLAARLLRAYASASDDFDVYGVLDYYLSYRAAVRAKVAALAAKDAAIPEPRRQAAAGSARRHLGLAARTLAPPGTGALVVLCGVIGTGKSSVAALVADELRGAVISSDRVRKHLAGLAATDRPGPRAREALYSAAMTRRVYTGLFERAEPVAASGRVAVLDATFAGATWRERARRWARTRGLPFLLVETRCALPVVRERLERRREEDRDASDAGPELLAQSRRWFRKVQGLPRGEHCVIRTDAPGWRQAARAASRRLRTRARGRPSV